jgi:eukaryotic-like serine/threonine-protein kinase
MALEIGSLILGRFRVERTLGEGGMGAVYVCVHERLNRRVAAKVLSLMMTDTLMGRFEDEAKLMSRINHPNVVQILDYGLVDGSQPCIVMELIEGIELEHTLITQKKLPWREATDLMIGVLNGLEAVHAAGVLHRDLKPTNIMIVQGVRKIPKIVDFGISRASRDPIGPKRTSDGSVVGTPAYMAPEQFFLKALDARTDIYQAAMVLFELVTGHLPFHADTMEQAMERVRTPPTGLPGPYRDESPELHEALIRALALAPEDRFASAGDFALALQEALAPQLNRRRPAVTEDAPIEIAKGTNATKAPSVDAVPSWIPAAEVVQEKGRFAVLVRLPTAILARPEEVEKLNADAREKGGGARGFSLGSALWIALGENENPERCMLEFALAIEERYGEHTEIRSTRLPKDFRLTPGMLSGLAKWPPALQTLLEAMM